MTRINVVHPSTLTDLHLLASYREHPRMMKFSYDLINSGKPWTHKQPKNYVLGTGHMMFFADKLGFIAKMQKQIVAECLHRGFQIQFTDCLFEQWRDKIPSYMWKDYKPTSEAIAINLERINNRLNGIKD